MGQLAVMDGTGDTKITWDMANDREVNEARAKFDDLKAKGHNAYKMDKKDGAKGEPLEKFDPYAEEIIMVPPMAGG